MNNTKIDQKGVATTLVAVTMTAITVFYYSIQITVYKHGEQVIFENLVTFRISF